MSAMTVVKVFFGAGAFVAFIGAVALNPWATWLALSAASLVRILGEMRENG